MPRRGHLSDESRRRRDRGSIERIANEGTRRYRRLALELRDEIDCYEVESLASRALVNGLNVTKVPSVQIYDPDGVTRLADSTCMPDDFPRVARKVDVVIQSMKKRRSAHRIVAKSYADELCEKRATAPATTEPVGDVCEICPD